MYSDPLSTTTPAIAGIDNPDCVKWREILPSQEESAGRDIPMGQLVTNLLVSRESPLPPCQLWPGHEALRARSRQVSTPSRGLRLMSVVRTPDKKNLVAFGVDEPNSSEPVKGLKEGVFQV